MCVSPQRRAIFYQKTVKKWSEPEVFCTFSLASVRFATAACNFSKSELQKVVRDRQFFNIFTCNCTFRHSGVQFLDIRTSKSAPNLRCFVHFDLRMCVSPQRRAIFGHQNFKKCSELEVFCTFWLENVRFATAACNFCFLHKTLSSAPAALAGLLFDWPDTRIIEKTQHFATSLTFRADVSSFFWFQTIASSVDWLDYSTAVLVICFSTLHIVGSFYLNFLRSISSGQIIVFHQPSFHWRLPGISLTKPWGACRSETAPWGRTTNHKAQGHLAHPRNRSGP